MIGAGRQRPALAGIEVVATYPRRTDVPKRLWTDLLRQAERSVDALAFAGLFLPEEHPDWLPTLRAKARAGVRVRLLLGDPEGSQLADRDEERAIGGGVAGRVAAVLAHYRPLVDVAYMKGDKVKEARQPVNVCLHARGARCTMLVDGLPRSGLRPFRRSNACLALLRARPGTLEQPERK